MHASRSPVKKSKPLGPRVAMLARELDSNDLGTRMSAVSELALLVACRRGGAPHLTLGPAPMQIGATEANACVGSGSARDAVAAGEIENTLLKVLSRCVYCVPQACLTAMPEPADGQAMPGSSVTHGPGRHAVTGNLICCCATCRTSESSGQIYIMSILSNLADNRASRERQVPEIRLEAVLRTPLPPPTTTHARFLPTHALGARRWRWCLCSPRCSNLTRPRCGMRLRFTWRDSRTRICSDRLSASRVRCPRQPSAHHQRPLHLLKLTSRWSGRLCGVGL